jgi:hypothetical protein
MKPAAIGLRIHSGWGTLVAVSNGGVLEVVERRHIIIADPGISGSKQPYHYAENLEVKKAEEYIARCSTVSGQLASRAIREGRGHFTRECVREFECPTCHAAPGNPCIGVSAIVLTMVISSFRAMGI